MRYLVLILTLFIVTPAWAKTVLVTTSTGGIGSVIARSLAEKGYDLILVGRSPEKLERQVNAFTRTYPKQSFEAICADYGELDQIQAISDEMRSRRLDGYVLLTPRPDFSGDQLMPEAKQWSTALMTTFIGPLEVLKGCLPALERGKARVVIISGTSSKQVLPKYASFGVIRAMWLSEAKALSHQFGPKGILINTVSPAEVLTPARREGIMRRADDNGRSFRDQMAHEAESVPLQKYAYPEDVAHAVAFLLDSRNTHITGTNLVLDGGVTVAF